MLTYVLLAALSDDYLPREYGGVYISQSGQPAIIDAGTYPDNPMILFNFPTRYIEVSRVRIVPAGNYYGEYAANRILTLTNEIYGNGDWTGTRETKDHRVYFPYGISSISPDAL